MAIPITAEEFEQSKGRPLIDTVRKIVDEFKDIITNEIQYSEISAEKLTGGTETRLDKLRFYYKVAAYELYSGKEYRDYEYCGDGGKIPEYRMQEDYMSHCNLDRTFNIVWVPNKHMMYFNAEEFRIVNCMFGATQFGT